MKAKNNNNNTYLIGIIHFIYKIFMFELFKRRVTANPDYIVSWNMRHK